MNRLLPGVMNERLRECCKCRSMRRPRQERLIVPLDQLEGNALGTLEEPQLSADVVHLVAQHGYAVGHEVRGGRLNVVDAERELIEPPFSQVRRVRTRISPWGRGELKQLDLERRIRSFECESDVLR